jgi:hypothetical protein
VKTLVPPVFGKEGKYEIGTNFDWFVNLYNSRNGFNEEET